MSSIVAMSVEEGSRASVSAETQGRLPCVSVGIPVYNGERYLEMAIRSVLTQTWADLELVISDNASTDRTETICRRFAAQDPRVRYYRNGSNIGATGNFGRAFELSRGTYFRWLCSDDYMGQTSIERCVAALEVNTDAVVACTRTLFVDGTGEKTWPYDAVQALLQVDACDRFRAAFEQDPWCNAAYGLIRRATLAKTALQGPFPASDKALIAELAMHGRIVEVAEPLFYRRIHPGAYSFAISDERDRTFYTPNAGNKVAPMLRAWPNNLAHMRALIRSPARYGEKLRMAAHVLRMAWWQRADMFGEASRWMRGEFRTR